MKCKLIAATMFISASAFAQSPPESVTRSLCYAKMVVFTVAKSSESEEVKNWIVRERFADGLVEVVNLDKKKKGDKLYKKLLNLGVLGESGPTFIFLSRDGHHLVGHGFNKKIPAKIRNLLCQT